MYIIFHVIFAFAKNNGIKTTHHIILYLFIFEISYYSVIKIMTSIRKNSNIITLINIFTVDPQNQQRLVDMLVETTEQIMNIQEGFISANIHKSLDGTRVVNYAQWASRDAFEKMLKNPKVIVHMNDILNIAKFDGGLYDVVFTEEKTL